MLLLDLHGRPPRRPARRPGARRGLVGALVAALIVLGASGTVAYQKAEAPTVWFQGWIVELLMPPVE